MRSFFLAGVTLCFAFVAQAQTKHTFEVVSVKPSNTGDNNTSIHSTPVRIHFENVPLKSILLMSFGIRSESLISGVPGWADSARYDIDAKVDEELAASFPKMPREQRQLIQQEMMQALLADRFQLKVSHAKKELPVYALTVAKTGIKLKEAVPPPPPPDADPSAPKRDPGTSTSMTNGRMEVKNGSMEVLANQLSRMDETDGRVVIDKTGLSGRYDWELTWSPEAPAPPFRGGDNNAPPPPTPDTSKPTLFTALQEQLGLKLEQDKAPVDLLVVDRLERPQDENHL